MAEEIENPTTGFVHFLARQVYGGKITNSVSEEFRGLTKTALQELIRERVNTQLETAKIQTIPSVLSPMPETLNVAPAEKTQCETTEEELEAFFIIRAIARAACNPNRVAIRDAASYCAILFDDNNRKPLARLYFNHASRMKIGIFSSKIEQVYELADLSDIYSHGEKLLAEIARYLNNESMATDFELAEREIGAA